MSAEANKGWKIFGIIAIVLVGILLVFLIGRGCERKKQDKDTGTTTATTQTATTTATSAGAASGGSPVSPSAPSDSGQPDSGASADSSAAPASPDSAAGPSQPPGETTATQAQDGGIVVEQPPQVDHTYSLSGPCENGFREVTYYNVYTDGSTAVSAKSMVPCEQGNPPD